ncbi:efflux RND transporter permease subunit [[Clostridium] polysaccharolyticum]|uniref:Multidrug efflux pump subunit AcrB n=1 Tax=[Clostridium] polysaccharolyticum TaxID=29364 RepID=A0A1I0C9F3_9FIRM|nr:efflux RND transporter permease subunit [[Clostridium] polysaccharolyticum]SET15487.1 Multidrug efflux pump subunit AcrB [[Clostridium] polysaccharolyticum]
MTKLFVKKPYFILVAVVIILTIGGVSLSRMQTDMLPELEMPYLAVITTEIGASPEKVENDITSTMESSLGTINGVENVSSTSADNYGMVMLEFAKDTNMEAALVRVSKAVSTMELPDGCGTPNIMEISTDMIATMYASVNYEGKDIKELSAFTDKVVKPFLERQDGVASVAANGMIQDAIEIRLNQKKIDKVNDKILSNANSKLADAAKKIEDAEKDLNKGKDELARQEKALTDKQNETNKQLSEAATQLQKAQATKIAYESSLSSLKASETALKAEKNAYKKAKAEENYKAMNQAFAQLNKNLGGIAEQSGVAIPIDIKDAVNNPKKLSEFIEWMKQIGQKEQAASLDAAALKKLYQIVEVRIPQIDAELENLKIKIQAAQAVLDTVNKQMEGLDEKQSQTTEAGYQATAGFGSGQAQIASGKQQMENAEKELKTAKEQLEDSKKVTLENANIDALLSMETLSGLLSAQDFAMPAGYIEDKNDNQWLVEVGEHFENKKQITSLVLTKIDGVGNIKLSDVADIVSVDNAGKSYTKVNGEDAVLLSIYKSSTSSTSTVSKKILSAFDMMEDKYKGLEFTTMMNQGEYISRILDSVLHSILLGAILAILVLALFLKDVKPTVVVAFSIPFSVLFALIIMYFTGININVMSLAGLCIGIGMLVDNSIVVMENIYRLRHRGIPAAKAAVQGAKQVAAPIIASTITTICVFLPMVYTSGMVSQLLIPFAFTISYALIASLLIALLVVPTMGSILLKNTKEQKHRIFDVLQEVYGKALAFCLRFKVVPLAIAIGLFVLSILQTSKTGLVMMDEMDSNQISVSLTLDEDTKREDAYKTADKVMSAILEVKGIAKVGAMDGNGGAMSSIMGSAASDNYTMFSFNVLTDDNIKTVKQFRKIKKDMENKTKDIACKKLTVSTSAMGDMSALTGNGLTVNVYGQKQEELIKISQDIMDMMKEIKGIENTSNGLDENSRLIHIQIDKNKAAAKNLTVAQIYQEIAKRATTDKTALTLSINSTDVDVNIVNKLEPVTYENILDMPIEVKTKDNEGKDVTKTYKLSQFAKKTDGYSLDSITRENQTRYLAVTGETKEGENTTLLSRKLQKKLDSYKAPEGYTVEIEGEVTQVMEMVKQMTEALALGFLLIYLVMVAQFQSLLSPFIIIFTVPLAFTGGVIGLKMFGQSISAMALMGFMILMGTVVNNGIVFVDYANQLRLKGVDKHTALIATGKTRMRPILMTALTTILSMSVMVFSQDAGNAMQKGMAIVVSVGLLYSTFMTLFIIPVMYDILFRREPKVIDVGDLEEAPDEAEELLEMMQAKNQ